MHKESMQATHHGVDLLGAVSGTLAGTTGASSIAAYRTPFLSNPVFLKLCCTLNLAAVFNELQKKEDSDLKEEALVGTTTARINARARVYLNIGGFLLPS
jgi:hypothetical protein